VLAGLSVWFIYALLGYFGVIKNTATRPWNRLPRRSRPASAQAAVANSVYEMLPHRRRAVPASALDGRPCPQMLIFEGANVGIYRQRP
jgi:hypothetical protein